MKLDRSKSVSKFSMGMVMVQVCALIASPDRAQADTYDDPVCDATCGPLVNASTQQVLGLDGTPGWKPTDDATCAALAANPTAVPSSAPSSSPGSTTSFNVATALSQCQWHVGQMDQQCMAYDAAEQAGTFQKILIPMDIAGAGICWTACAQPANAALDSACSYTSIASSATEAVGVLIMKSSAIGKAVTGSLSAVGVTGGILTFKASGAVAGAAEDADYDDDGKMIQNADTKAAAKKAREMACATAAALTIMTTLRTIDYENGKNSRQKACATVKSLAGNSSTVGTGTIAAAVGSSTAPGGTITTSSGTNSALSSNAPLASSAPTPACAQNGLGTQPGGCGLNPVQLAATDATMLNGTPLGQAAAQQLTPANTAGLFNALNSGASPSSVLKSGLGNADSMQPLADLAKVTTEHASELGAVGGIAPTFASAGGAAETGSEMPAFPDAAPSTPASELGFTAPPTKTSGSDDIWHTGYTGSIFDIVSQKIGVAKSRVDGLEWSTPLNRALAGLPAQSSQRP